MAWHEEFARHGRRGGERGEGDTAKIPHTRKQYFVCSERFSSNILESHQQTLGCRSGKYYGNVINASSKVHLRDHLGDLPTQ